MNIIVYSMNGCPQCVQASNLLLAKGIAHTVIKVDEDEEVYEFFKTLGHRSIPQMYVKQGDALVHLFDYSGLKKLTEDQLEIFKNR